MVNCLALLSLLVAEGSGYLFSKKITSRTLTVSSKSTCNRCVVSQLRLQQPDPTGRIWTALQETRDAVVNVNSEQPMHSHSLSFIESITCLNFAGVFDNDSQDEKISIPMTKRMVVVTGETGSGKSLLTSKLVDVVTGGKATASLVPKEGDTATVEITICLAEPHLSWVQKALTEMGHRELPEDDGIARMTVQRVLERGKRLISTSKINDAVVTLKTVRQVVAPLVVVVDTPTAAAALSRPNSRLAVLDSAVDSMIFTKMRDSHTVYSQARKYREKLQRDLENMPPSISGKIDSDMLRHWVDEFDVFQGAIEQFCASLNPGVVSRSNFVKAAQELSCVEWSADDSTTLYTKLLDFREAIREMDTKFEAATLARDALVAVSSAESAIAALERARNSLIDSVTNEDSSSQLACAAERAHDRFNLAEQALREAAKALEDDSTGLISLMETAKSSVQVSAEDVDSLLAEWNSLARKHGVSPFSLPSCHHALRNELNGNVEARSQLPVAKEAEGKALQAFAALCSELSHARLKVAETLSTAVTARLPSLGMTGSKLVVDLHSDVVGCEHATTNGVDHVAFLLQHEDATESGGALDVVASAGEKARIMLAMECELPGSAGALCRASEVRNLPPITVLYDEIDAHVGGRAAVSMARMLAMQSGQVISITHSPSVAAVAETHLVVQKHSTTNYQKVLVTVKKVDGDLRKKELARMASGDLATDEAEHFASALLRYGAAMQNLGP
jgi:DNA repair ATPase RecN